MQFFSNQLELRFSHLTWIISGKIDSRRSVDAASNSGVSVMAVRIAGVEAGSKLVPTEEPALICSEGDIRQRFHYWRGASGRRYLHSVYSLVECPQIPKANYILVEWHDDDSRSALRIGKTVDEVYSLNLAYLRHMAATIGASEVHIHVLAETEHDRLIVESDLQAGLFSQLTPESTNHFSPMQLC